MANISKLGTDHNGNDVFSIILESDLLEAQILNFGATLKNLRFLESGSSLVLGYQNLEEYLNDKNYAGVTIGRYANRISNGRYFSNSKQFDLDKNENLTTLHGGSQSCHNAPWLIQDCKRNYVELAYQFKDGDMGFGGDLSVNLRYDLNGPNLRLTIEANTSESSLCNFTNHSYFNLDCSDNIKNHCLSIKSNKIVEVNENKLPTGKLKSVDGSRFDFRTERKLSDHQGVMSLIDTNYCFSTDNTKLRVVAELVTSECKMVLCTTEPGLQVYTGSSLKPPLQPFQGIALEPQIWPDSPNNPGFPNAFLKSGEKYKQITEYSFTKNHGCN
jgi:aldose 1-epimerase